MGLRDVAATTPAPVGIEDWAQAQDGQMKGIDPALRTGEQERQRQNETERECQRESGKGESRVRILPRSRIWIKVEASQKHSACGNTGERQGLSV